MYENKQKVTFGIPKDGEVVLGDGTLVYVKPYLELTDMAVLMSEYMEEFFKDSPTHVIQAEYKLILALLDACTSVEIDEKTIGGLLSNFKVLEEIKSKIKNYGEFRALLKQTVEEKKEQKRLELSLGKQIESVVRFFTELSTLEITDENMANAKELVEILKDSPIKEILKKVG